MSTISFNYQQTIAQQKEIEAAATELNTKCATLMAEIIENVNAAWTGDSAKAFNKFLQKKKEEIELQSKELKTISQYIATSAETLRRMEEENAARAGVN